MKRVNFFFGVLFLGPSVKRPSTRSEARCQVSTAQCTGEKKGKIGQSREENQGPISVSVRMKQGAGSDSRGPSQLGVSPAPLGRKSFPKGSSANARKKQSNQLRWGLGTRRAIKTIFPHVPGDAGKF